MCLAHMFPNSASIFGFGVHLDNELGLVVNERILHHLVQMLELSLIEVRISNVVTLVHQMSKILGFKSNHESVLALDPVVAFPKDLEIASAHLA